MKKKYKTLFVVKSSLISLYVALTLPIPFISIEELKVISIILFALGFFLIIDITSDFTETTNDKIIYETTFISNIIGNTSWEVYWKDIKLIKSSPTSQGSKVYYFITNNDQKFLVPQRIENLEEFLSLVQERTAIKTENMNYISPMWTYKLLTMLSLLMIIGEIITFSA